MRRDQRQSGRLQSVFSSAGGDFERVKDGFETSRRDPDAIALSQIPTSSRVELLRQAGWPKTTAEEIAGDIDNVFGLNQRSGFRSPDLRDLFKGQAAMLMSVPRAVDLIESPVSRAASTIAQKVGEIAGGATDPIGSFEEARSRTKDVTGQRRPAPLGPGLREGASLLVPAPAVSEAADAYTLALQSMLGELTLLSTGQAPRSLEEARKRWSQVHPGIRFPAELAADLLIFPPTGAGGSRIAKRTADIAVDRATTAASTGAERIRPVVEAAIAQERGGGRPLRPKVTLGESPKSGFKATAPDGVTEGARPQVARGRGGKGRRPPIDPDDLDLPTGESPETGILRKWEGKSNVGALEAQQYYENG